VAAVRLSSLRKFNADPLLAAQATAMTEDQRSHPVIAALRRRREQGSKPGARTDSRRIALVIEGGAMRGVVSAGMTAAIEQLGFTDCFDEVHGASAGAFAGAFLLAGQAAYLVALYPHGFGNPVFASAGRVLRGRPVFDLDYVVHEVWRHQRPLRTDRILNSGIELHLTATDVDTTEQVDLTQLADDEQIRTAILASSRLPWLAGKPVWFRDRRLLDPTLSSAIPVDAPRRTATDMLVLQTRPQGIAHSPLSGPVSRLTVGYLGKLNPALVPLLATRSARYDRLSAELAAAAADPTSTPAVCVIRPPAHVPRIGQMENRAAPLSRAGSYGMRAAWMALTGEDPDLVSVPRAYSSSSCPCVPVGDDSRSSSAYPSSGSILRGSAR
jgi:predicted patatin/cPLA2 family phospholipase